MRLVTILSVLWFMLLYIHFSAVLLSAALIDISIVIYQLRYWGGMREKVFTGHFEVVVQEKCPMESCTCIGGWSE